jgi:hypothetical protein
MRHLIVLSVLLVICLHECLSLSVRRDDQKFKNWKKRDDDDERRPFRYRGPRDEGLDGGLYLGDLGWGNLKILEDGDIVDGIICTPFGCFQGNIGKRDDEAW